MTFSHYPGSPPRRKPTQLDLFGTVAPSTSAVIIPAERPCSGCGGTSVVVGSSKGMHHAATHCAECGRFAGWLPGWRYRALTGETTFTSGLSSHVAAGDVPW